MADVFFALSAADRRDALDVAAARSGRAVHLLLEKDVWVVWTHFDGAFSSKVFLA